MNVRFKMTDKGEVAILPRKDYEALAAKALESGAPAPPSGGDDLHVTEQAVNGRRTLPRRARF